MFVYYIMLQSELLAAQDLVRYLPDAFNLQSSLKSAYKVVLVSTCSVEVCFPSECEGVSTGVSTVAFVVDLCPLMPFGLLLSFPNHG